MNERHRILIIYRSGARVEVECDSAQVMKETAGEGRITKMTIKGGSPRFLFLNVSQIESVWEIDPA